MATGATPKAAQPPTPPPVAKHGIVWRIASYVPGTKAYEQRKSEAVALTGKNLLNGLRAIFPEDEPREPGEPPRMRFTNEGIKMLFATKAAQLTFWREELGNWLLWSFVVGGTLTTVAVCAIARRSWHIHQPHNAWALVFLATVLIGLGAAATLAITDKLFTNFLEESLSTVAQNVGTFSPLGFYLLALLVAMHYVRLSSAPPLLVFVLSEAVFVFGVFVVSSTIWLIAMISLLRIADRQLWRANPSAFLFQELLGMFPLRTSTFQQPDRIAGFMRNLERVAFLLEDAMVEKLRTGDPDSDAWLEKEMKGHAAAIRELKTTAIYSRGDVPERLKLNLEYTLMHFCNLRWDLLEKAAVPIVSKRERARRFAERVLSALTVSILPAAILLARLLVPAIQSFDQKDILLVGALVWLCFNLLSVLDPNYNLTKQTLEVAGKIRALGGGGHASSAEEH